MPERRPLSQIDIGGVINDARSALQHNSHDVAHGVEHHQNVADNVDFIVNAEGIRQEINYNALKCAAWWHDYDRHSGDYSVMTNSLQSRGAGPDFIQKVVGIIDGHSKIFGKKTKEQGLLVLADKIEYVDLDRYLVSTAKMSGPELFIVKSYWKSKIKQVVRLMNNTPYQSARELFSKKFKQLVEHIRQENSSDLVWFKGLI